MADKHIVKDVKIEKERAQFRTLLLANENYFGNALDSKVKAIVNIAGNTSYEELKCVGLYPEFDTLEAIVYIKKNGGYGGDICSDGTPEYVRFYLSYDNGTTWQDQGVTSFTAQDIPSPKPLEYAVQLKIAPPKKLCKFENLPLVRAVLSWNFLPPANSPNWTPVWGNVVNGQVQIDPFQFIIKQPIDILKDISLVALLKENNLIAKDLTTAQLQKLDLDEFKKELQDGVLHAAEKELSAGELHELYKGQKVEAKRYLFPAVQQLVAPKKALASLKNVTLSKSPNFTGLAGIDLGNIIGELVKTDGDIGYEELGCVGLNTNNDNLEATIKIKRPYGFLGGLCTKGSREYVAFWMDFGAGWQYVGTTSVRTHDIAGVPAKGLDYAVSLPVNLAPYRQTCEKGPRTAKVRAILSWETPPNPGNPNQVPHWGNREETLVFITPGQGSVPGTHTPMIETVGGMAVADINASGYANGAAVTAGFSATDSPFGGEIVLAGHLAYPADISAGAVPLEYRVRVSDDGGATWQTVSNSFGLHRTQLLDGVWSTLPVITQAAPAEWYTYREDLSAGPGNAQIFVSGNILARWQTNATMDDQWKVKIESRVAGTVAPVWTSDVVTVVVDNHAPDVMIDITSGGGVCADFTAGTVISGPYHALDNHFSAYQFQLVPSNGGTFTVNPSGGGTFSGGPSSFSRSYPAVSSSGESGMWEFDTTGVPQCGYVIYLHAWDRTIVNSGYVGHYGSDVVGVCIRG